MNARILELREKARKLDSKSIKYSNKIKPTITNEQFEKLEKLEEEAEIAFDEYLTEYYRSIGGTKPDFKEPDFPKQYEPNDEIGYSERLCSDDEIRYN